MMAPPHGMNVSHSISPGSVQRGGTRGGGGASADGNRPRRNSDRGREGSSRGGADDQHHENNPEGDDDVGGMVGDASISSSSGGGGGGTGWTVGTTDPSVMAAAAMAASAHSSASAGGDGSNRKRGLPGRLGMRSEPRGVGGASAMSKSSSSAGPSSPSSSFNRRIGGSGGATGTATTPTSAQRLRPQPATLSSLSAITKPSQQPPSEDNPFTSVYQDELFHRPNIPAAESILSGVCTTLGFDIAEMWLRTGPKTHQLIHSYLSPPSVGTEHDERFHHELVEVYYGEKSAERTHRLSPALCKRAKEAMDVIWVAAHNEHGADALRCAISDVRTAVAVPVCQESSRTNMTLIYFSVRRALMRPAAVEFLVHMSLAAAISSVETFADEIFIDSKPKPMSPLLQCRSEHSFRHAAGAAAGMAELTVSQDPAAASGGTASVAHNNGSGAAPHPDLVSPFGARLDMRWADLMNVEYLTDGGNNWIHTAVVGGRPVVVKTLKPECQDVALAINEIEGELEIHSKLQHPNIVGLIGAGTTSKGNRFVVLERLDGGTLSQVLGYDTRIRDRRRRFWKRKQMSYVEVLNASRSLADALAYCQGRAVPGCMCLHRDIKPDNIGFTLDGTLKLLDFGLARVVENASPYSEEVYHMSGETGSLRYMAPEVADSRPYNQKADVYSFGIIMWEMLAYKKPYDGMNRESFYVRVVKGDERPHVHKKWPKDICKLMAECWSADMHNRPNFDEIVERLDSMLKVEKGNGKNRRGLAALIDRHSTWF